MKCDTGGRGRTDTPVRERDFESRASANSATPATYYGGGNRTRTGGKGVADPCLTAWLCRHKVERKTGVEPATSTLARWRSTTELLPQKLGYLDSNQGMTGSKPVALPLGYTPIILGRTRGIEPPSAGITIRCVNHFATTAIITII